MILLFGSGRCQSPILVTPAGMCGRSRRNGGGRRGMNQPSVTTSVRTAWAARAARLGAPSSTISLTAACDGPSSAAMMFWVLITSGQINICKVDGWQTPIDLPARNKPSCYRRLRHTEFQPHPGGISCSAAFLCRPPGADARRIVIRSCNLVFLGYSQFAPGPTGGRQFPP